MCFMNAIWTDVPHLTPMTLGSASAFQALQIFGFSDKSVKTAKKVDGFSIEL